MLYRYAEYFSNDGQCYWVSKITYRVELSLAFNVVEQLIGKSLNPWSQEIDAPGPEAGRNQTLEPSVHGRIREQHCLSACEWVQLGQKRPFRCSSAALATGLAAEDDHLLTQYQVFSFEARP